MCILGYKDWRCHKLLEPIYKQRWFYNGEPSQGTKHTWSDIQTEECRCNKLAHPDEPILVYIPDGSNSLKDTQDACPVCRDLKKSDKRVHGFHQRNLPIKEQQRAELATELMMQNNIDLLIGMAITDPPDNGRQYPPRIPSLFSQQPQHTHSVNTGGLLLSLATAPPPRTARVDNYFTVPIDADSGDNTAPIIQPQAPMLWPGFETHEQPTHRLTCGALNSWNTLLPADYQQMVRSGNAGERPVFADPRPRTSLEAQANRAHAEWQAERERNLARVRATRSGAGSSTMGPTPTGPTTAGFSSARPASAFDRQPEMPQNSDLYTSEEQFNSPPAIPPALAALYGPSAAGPSTIPTGPRSRYGACNQREAQNIGSQREDRQHQRAPARQDGLGGAQQAPATTQQLVPPQMVASEEVIQEPQDEARGFDPRHPRDRDTRKPGERRNSYRLPPPVPAGSMRDRYGDVARIPDGWMLNPRGILVRIPEGMRRNANGQVVRVIRQVTQPPVQAQQTQQQMPDSNQAQTWSGFVRQPSTGPAGRGGERGRGRGRSQPQNDFPLPGPSRGF